MHKQPNERPVEEDRQDWSGMHQQQAVADPRGQIGHTNRTKADPPPKLPEPTPRMRGEQSPQSPQNPQNPQNRPESKPDGRGRAGHPARPPAAGLEPPDL